MIETGEFVEVKTAPTVGKTRELIYNEMRRDVAEWMTAKEDLVYRPAVELTEEAGEFAARALVPGIHAGNLEVWVTPERLLIKGKNLMRSIEFPRPVDPEKVYAEIIDGILSIHAKIARTANVAIFRPRAA